MNPSTWPTSHHEWPERSLDEPFILMKTSPHRHTHTHTYTHTKRIHTLTSFRESVETSHTISSRVPSHTILPPFPSPFPLPPHQVKVRTYLAFESKHFNYIRSARRRTQRIKGRRRKRDAWVERRGGLLKRAGHGIRVPRPSSISRSIIQINYTEL